MDIIVLLGFSKTINKSSWPELAGINGAKAKEVIENENQQVTGVILSKGTSHSLDICCSHIFIWVDDRGNTAEVPTIG
ncbi:hypothetical protein EUGRSUZ_H05126 [Eucalyptus grandis]|uniref:Uncharacterized protein n=2 Tax=Eucalyptus grandis TaxID=71139 RepID=A0ACC3JYI2_EUCGR|nr:hypothetical protein EUGRSUZ_H05126 [Eucalyptus grandis]